MCVATCVATCVPTCVQGLHSPVGTRGASGPERAKLPGEACPLLSRCGHLCWRTLSGGRLGTGSENLSLK